MKTMKNHTKNAAVISGTLVTGLVAGLAADNANANELFEYSALGSGYELRSDVLDMNTVERALTSNTVRAKVWEDKCGEGKCGEGKCGEEKKKEEPTTEKKTEEAKPAGTEAAAVAPVATEKKTEEAKPTEKTKEAKCGEGKCGM